MQTVMANDYEEIKILSLNTWGLHYVAKNVTERLRDIAEELPQYDIACLQEVWSDNDYDMIVDSVKSELPYSIHYPSGIIGSGLCIFSRYPIMNTYSHEYRVTHTIKQFANGEKFAKKGIIGGRIEMPLSLGHITVFNTHINGDHRDNQIAELLQFISCIADHSPIILCGDFNTEPNHEGYKIITKILHLTDAFVDDPQHTCDLSTNIYTKRGRRSKRIDYIFYSSKQFNNNCSLEVKSHQLSLSGNVPNKRYPYSDHEGLEVLFNIIPSTTGPYCHDIIEEDSLRSLDLLSNQINNHLAPLKRTYHSKNKSLVLLWLLLFLLSLVISVLMIMPGVYDALSKYYLQILCSIIPSISWIISLLIFFYTLDTMHIMRGMFANHKQINLLINYHRYKLKHTNSYY